MWTLIFAVIIKVTLSEGQDIDFGRETQSPNNINLDTCQYLKNVTDVEMLDQHQYATLEQCLYYYLAEEAQKKQKRFGILNALAALPPQAGTKSTPIKVFFQQVTLQHYELDEFRKELNIHGYMNVSWNDPRLRWDENTWKLKDLKIHTPNHVWVPVITSQSLETALRNGDAMEFRRVVAMSNGTLRTLINFSLKTFCDDTDFKSFPQDVYKCCYTFEPHFNQENLDFKTNGLPIFTDPKHFRDSGWSMSGSPPTTYHEAGNLPQVGFCVHLQRATSSLWIELTVPTTVCTVLLLLTPVFGHVHIQLTAKMFIILLQFIAMMLFSNRIAPHFGTASATPKILRFHEFAIVMNTLSICCSAVIWTLIRIRRTLPPWGWLIRWSHFVNRCLCRFNLADSSNVDSTLNANKGLSQQLPNADYQSDWTNAFIAIHSLSTFAMSVIVAFGYLVLM
ncbi:hypothetical protein AB6A40_004024 [Gnathostoma spinigerum]|uniref:Neurotransmitter-gated ion-channel ligand-binding domain-containing protein n=1 Tax=Gnathostoma spinigerum TaxID=75299 RepID=A0ABD6EBA0_9BILA